MPALRRASVALALCSSVLLPTSSAHALVLPGDTRNPAVVDQTPPTSPEALVAERDLPPAVVAVVEGVELRSPTRHLAVAGFHEGSTRSVELEPVGVEADRPLGPSHHVHDAPVALLPSRGRAAPATSAVDLAVEEDTELVSPVSGTVVGVSTYALYGQTRDWLVEVVPDAAPHLVVRIFHLEDPLVEVGQHLEAGRTPFAGSARLLPFPSQVDRMTTRPLPHVHVQVDRD